MPVGRDTHRDGSPRIDRSGSGLQRSQGFPSSWRSPDADDLGDLVDPQNDTYEEEGTHGLPLAIGAAVKTYGKLRTNPKTAPVVKAGEQALKSAATTAAGRVADYTKDKMAERKGGPGVGTPEDDDPLA